MTRQPDPFGEERPGLTTRLSDFGLGVLGWIERHRRASIVVAMAVFVALVALIGGHGGSGEADLGGG